MALKKCCISNSGRAVLGISAADADPNLAAQNGLAVDHGALIASVTPGGPADKAGLKPGDVIVQIDGNAVDDVQSLAAILLSKKPGDIVSVQYYRGNQQRTTRVSLAEFKIS